MFLFLVRQRPGLSRYQALSCELISNYVLIFGSTTISLVSPDWCKLWIDFKLCSYFWFDNNPFLIHRLVIVVNWFQIMFLFLVRQLLGFYKQVIDSCELISNYVLIFGSTTLILANALARKLWIDFKLCSYFWFDNINKFYQLRLIVVNWFQIMFLFLVRQQFPVLGNSFVCCELISNYVLIFGSTTGSCYCSYVH